MSNQQNEGYRPREIPVPKMGSERWLPFVVKLKLPIYWILVLLLGELYFGHPAIMTIDGDYLSILGHVTPSYAHDRTMLVTFVVPEKTYFQWTWHHLKRLNPF